MNDEKPNPAERRVVFISHTAQRSGAEAVMLALIERLRAENCPVTLVCPSGAVSNSLPAGTDHVTIAPLGLSGSSGLRRVGDVARLLVNWLAAGLVLRRLVADPRNRIVVNSLFALPAVAVTLARQRCSWLVHDTVSSTKQRVIVALSSRVIRLAVAVSEATATPLREMRFGSRFDVVVVPNGVNVDVPEAPVVHAGRPIVGVLGTLTAWKGQDVLLRAAALVDGVDVELAGAHMPGDEDYIAGLHELANDPRLAGRVRFLGHVDAADCLNRWTALVSPSVLPEAGPLGVLEAMSRGCPVIGTDRGGTADYGSDGIARLVPPAAVQPLAEALREVIGDIEVRRCMARRGRERVAQRHDIDVTMPEMLAWLTR